MTVEFMNPDNPTARLYLDDPDIARKFVAMIVWKLKRDAERALTADSQYQIPVYSHGITITLADMEEFAKQANSGDAVLVTHGHQESIEFRIVTKREGERLVADHNGPAAYRPPHAGHAAPNPQPDTGSKEKE